MREHDGTVRFVPTVKLPQEAEHALAALMFLAHALLPKGFLFTSVQLWRYAHLAARTDANNVGGRARIRQQT